MKKTVMVCLLVTTGILAKVGAQVNPLHYSNDTKTDKLFEVNNPDWLRDKFTIQLTKGNKITIELSDKKGLLYVQNLDSLLSQCYNKIALLQDSLKNELTSKRIDIALQNDGNVKMRFQEFTGKASTYTVLNKELYGLKVEQDTINIIGYYPSATPVKWSKKILYLSMPYKIVLFLNNVTELKEYLDGGINKATAQLKNDWDNYNNAGKKDSWNKKLVAGYSIADATKNTTFGRAPSGLRKSYLGSYFSFGAQNVQNLFVPSFAAGLEVFYIADEKKERHFQLFTDNYLFFERNPGVPTKIMHNSFLTFQYKSVWDIKMWNEKSPVKFYQQFSVSYLITRRGNYFEKNTFKVGLPGFESHNVQLTPGFIFNGFFKKASPTITLSIHLGG